MPAPLQDDLTDQPNLSRQRRYQIRKARQGCCRLCGQQAPTGQEICIEHQIEARVKRKLKRLDVI